MRRTSTLRFGAGFVFLTWSVWVAWTAPAKITLQLPSPLSASQASYYLGQSGGFFKAAGLEVVLAQADNQAEAISAVGAGRADVGIADATTVIAVRAQGVPLVIVASMGDKSARAIYSLASSAIGSPKDLAAKRVGTGPLDTDRTLFPLLAQPNGFRVGDVTFVPMDLTERIASLATGNVQAVTGGLDQNRILTAAIGADKLRHLLWADSGFDVYGECFFVRSDVLRAKAGPLSAFLSASFRAWVAALKSPDQAIAALGMSQVIDHDQALRLADELADMKELFDTDTYRTKGIGYLDPQRILVTVDADRDYLGVPVSFTPADVMSAALLPKTPVRMPQPQKAAAAAPQAMGTTPAGVAPKPAP